VTGAVLSPDGLRQGLSDANCIADRDARHGALRGAGHGDQEHPARLEQFHGRLTRCRVTVRQTSRHHPQARRFTVNIGLRVPGREIVASRDHGEDAYVALRDAFDSARRQLEDAAREMRGEVKAHPLPERRVSAGRHRGATPP
jgi:ribosome-associated translation inhibitor RaiA